MTAQLRIYTINRGQLDRFAEEWKEKVLPLRVEHGFQIEAAWTIESTNQFVWLISYEGNEDWQAKEEAYYSSVERTSMEPNPARLIAQPEHFEIERVL